MIHCFIMCVLFDECNAYDHHAYHTSCKIITDIDVLKIKIINCYLKEMINIFDDKIFTKYIKKFDALCDIKKIGKYVEKYIKNHNTDDDDKIAIN
jgi:hypothetical protein